MLLDSSQMGWFLTNKRRNTPLTCLLPLQKKISASQSPPAADHEENTRWHLGLRPFTWQFLAENGVPQGQTPPRHRRVDAACSLESANGAGHRKAARQKSSSWVAKVTLSLCYTFSGGVSLKWKPREGRGEPKRPRLCWKVQEAV